MHTLTKTRVLNENDIEEVSRFYAQAGRNVAYYQEMFDTIDCSEEIYKNFKPDVAASIRTGYCWGVYEHGVLVGCILAVDWKLYAEQHPTLLDHMFIPEKQTTKDIKKFISDITGPVVFVYAVIIEDSRRCQGHATALIKRLTKALNKQCTIVSDCIYDNANSMWLNNGYKIDQISDVLKLAVIESE